MGGLQRSHTIAPASPDELLRRRAPVRRPDMDRLSDAGASTDADAVHAFGLQPAGAGRTGGKRPRAEAAGRRPLATPSRSTAARLTPAKRVHRPPHLYSNHPWWSHATRRATSGPDHPPARSPAIRLGAAPKTCIPQAPPDRKILISAARPRPLSGPARLMRSSTTRSMSGQRRPSDTLASSSASNHSRLI